MMEVKENFIADSNGQCFFCSKISTNRFPHVKLKTHTDSLPLPSQQHYSLQQLSRYLRINMSNVFSDGGKIPTKLLEKVTRAKLKVELCEECVSLNETFSKLFRKLEKIEMEVISCVHTINSRLMKGKGLHTNGQHFIHNLTSSSEWNLEQGKRRIVDRLIVDTMQKCQQKINDELPRVKIQRLSMTQMEAERVKIKANRVKQGKIKDSTHATSSRPELEAVQLKVEESDHDTLEGDDMADPDFVDYDNDSGDEDKEFKKLQTSVSGTSTMTNNKTNRKRVRGRYSIISATNRLDPGSFTFTRQTKKYNCNLCSVEYGSHQYFKEHYNTAHLQAKWKCNICARLFNHRSAFNYHDRVVHRHFKQKINCQFCPKLFSHTSSRRRHVRTNHCQNGAIS